MKKKGLSQEGLKLIACITMLIDHVGAALLPCVELRIIGRIAFPIYCFLLAEGAARTRDSKRYAMRLAIGMLLSELPFDLLFFGGLTWRHQSVMVTLLLGFLMTQAMERVKPLGLQLLIAVPFAVAAEWLGTDYGGWGVMMVALFALTREMPGALGMQTVGVALLCWLIGGMKITIGTMRMPVEMFGVFAIVPIGCYSGKKATGSRLVQWGFYLFYPVHLTVLLLIDRFL